MMRCYDHWRWFVRDNKITFLTTEQKVIYKDLYHGTLDAIVMWDGVVVLLDLKFWGCWYFALCLPEAPTELKMSSNKLAKTNFQTYLYKRSEKKHKPRVRCVVAINPLGLQSKVFSREPKAKFEEAILLLQSQTDDF